MSKSKEAWAYADIEILDLEEVVAMVKLTAEDILKRQREGSFPQPFTAEGLWDANDIYGWLIDHLPVCPVVGTITSAF